MSNKNKNKNENENENEDASKSMTLKFTNFLKKSNNILIIIILIINVIIMIYLLKTHNKSKMVYPIGITIFIYLLLRYYYAPRPTKSYMVSLLFDYDYGIKSKFKHKNKIDNDQGWPFIASTPLKINNIQHIFIGGGNKQQDALLIFDEIKNEFINVIHKTNLSSNSNTYSSVSMDMDKDGKDDLIIGRKDGVYFYKNLNNYKFKMTKIIDKLDKVPLGIAISDYNKDGNPDLYLSYFTPVNKYKGTVFNNASHGRKNILLESIKKNNKIQFKDVTQKTNSSGKLLNTFTSSFIDLNNDSWPDLVLSHDSGEVEILKNNKGVFQSMVASELKGNYMGIAAGDYDNDGDQDLFLTNIGKDTSKNKMSLGDIKQDQTQTFKHLLLRNDGNFKFVEESKEKGISGDGFGWGAIFTDIDLDGNLDLLFAENTVLFPQHFVFPNPGHYYKNNNGKFERKFKYRNPNFGQTPIHTDINNDNIKDIVWINMEGPVVAYINKKTNNNYIILDLPKNNDFVNCKIVVNTGTKKFYRENIIGGTGFGGDTNDGVIKIGLGKFTSIKDIYIYLINGKEYTIKNPKINSILKATKK
jgi:hypothetical protein